MSGAAVGHDGYVWRVCMSDMIPGGYDEWSTASMTALFQALAWCDTLEHQRRIARGTHDRR